MLAYNIASMIRFSIRKPIVAPNAANPWTIPNLMPTNTGGASSTNNEYRKNINTISSINTPELEDSNQL